MQLIWVVGYDWVLFFTLNIFNSYIYLLSMFKTIKLTRRAFRLWYPPLLAIFMTLGVPWESAGHLQLVHFHIFILLLWLILGWLCRHCVFIKCFGMNNLSHSLHYPIFCRVCIGIKVIGTQNRVFGRSIPILSRCSRKICPLTQNLRTIKGKAMKTYFTVLVCLITSPGNTSFNSSGLGCWCVLGHRSRHNSG